MAKLHGKNANVFWKGGTIPMSAQSWTVEITADIAEVTEMQDDWKRFIAGQTAWTATVEGSHYGSAVSKIGTGSAAGHIGVNPSGTDAKLDLYLVYDTGDYNCIHGDAICVSISPVVDSKDAGRVSYSFQGASALSTYAGASVHTY